MEQHRMHSQQPTHNANDVASMDILHSPFYPSYRELQILDSSKVTQAPHSPSSYVQQQYAPDSGASLEDGGSHPLPYHIHEQRQQGHPRFDPSPPPQQHQAFPAVVYSQSPHDHERPYPTPQGLSHPLSRAPAPPARMPWPNDDFSDNSSAQPMAPQGGISPIYGPPYPLHPQLVYPPQSSHRPAHTHAPPEQSQPATTPGPSTFHEQHRGRAITDHGRRPRWGGVGSLDPATGVFSPVSDHPRIRTPQACEKCRARKAKCSGDHPTCHRCLERGLECKYAPERRMRGPNKPKPPLPLMPEGSLHPAVAEGQRTRRRASTLPTTQRRELQMWGQQQRQQQQKQKQQQQHQQQQEQTVVAAVVASTAAAASPASSASSAGSGSMGYLPLSESEASPMTPHSSLDGRHSTGVSFPASPGVLVQDYSANTRPGVMSHVSEGNRYGHGGDHDGAGAAEGMVAGMSSYGQDVFPDLSMRLSFENPKTF